jgi:hypothetical protein
MWERWRENGSLSLALGMLYIMLSVALVSAFIAQWTGKLMLAGMDISAVLFLVLLFLLPLGVLSIGMGIEQKTKRG